MTKLNKHSTIWPNWPNDWAVFWVLICTVHLTVSSCHDTYALQSESTLYSCLNVKELLASSRREIWSLRDCNWTRTQNHLVRKWTLKRTLKRTLTGLEPSCCPLNFRFRACFKQRIPWHSGNYRVWIHYETRTWHDKNIQSNYDVVLINYYVIINRDFISYLKY